MSETANAIMGFIFIMYCIMRTFGLPQISIEITLDHTNREGE